MQTRLGGLNVCWNRQMGRTKPVLFQHCTLATGQAWAKVVQSLGPELTYFSSDLPGHGRTGFDPDRGFQEQAADVVRALVEIAGAPVHFVGHSFGATVGLEVARKQPDLFQTMTLYEPVLFGVLDDAGHPEWDREIVEQKKFIDAIDQGPEAGAKEFFRRWGGAHWDDIPDKLRTYITDRVKFAALSEPDLFGAPPRRVSLNDITTMTHPATIMAGTDTPATARAIADVIAGAMPNGQLSILSGAGHMGPITHPDEVAAAIHARL